MSKNKHDTEQDPIKPYESSFKFGEDLKKTHPHQKKAMVISRDTKWRDSDCRDRKKDTAFWTFG